MTPIPEPLPAGISRATNRVAACGGTMDALRAYVPQDRRAALRGGARGTGAGAQHARHAGACSGELHRGAGDDRAAREYLAECLTIVRTLGPARVTQEALTVTAAVVAPAVAAGLLGAVSTLLAAQSGQLDAAEQQVADVAAARARAVLGAEVYAATFAAGQALSWEAAVAQAQAALDAEGDPAG